MSRTATVAARVAAAVGTVLALALGLAPAGAAPVTEAADGISAAVVSEPPAVVADGDAISVTVAVDNSTTRPLDGAEVAVGITQSPLTSRAALEEFVAHPEGPYAVVGLESVGAEVAVSTPPDGEATTIARLAPGASTTVTVADRPGTLPFDPDAWGVHGIVVVLRTPDGASSLLTGAITWEGTGIPEVEVAAIATAAGTTSTARAIAAASDLPGVALALDPTALPLLGLGGAEELLTGDREVYRLPMLHPDLLSLAHAGDDALLPYALSRSLRAGDGVVAAVPWLAVAPAADAPTAALAAANGARALLLDPGAGDALSLAATPDGPLAILRPDPVLSELAVRDATEPGAAATVVAATALRADEVTGPTVVSTGTDWSPSAADPALALEAIVTAPFVTPVAVAAAVDAASVTASLDDAVDTAADLPPEAVAGLSDRLSGVTRIAATAEAPNAVLDPAGRSLLTPVATALRDEPALRTLRLSRAQSDVDATLGALSIASGSDVNLIATSGSLPVTVRNDLDVEATVAVDLTSFSPNLQIRDTPTVTVPPGASESVLVEVEGVSSANVVTRIVLRNPSGEIVGDAVTMSVRVRADWGTAVTAFFTAGLVLLLVMGVIRTIRRGRKETRTGPRTSPSSELPLPDTEPDSDTDPDPDRERDREDPS